MAGFFSKSVAKIFGTKSDKDIKAVMPYVVKTNEVYATLASLSNDELRAKTEEVKTIINNHLQSIDEKIAALQKEATEDKSLDVHQKEALFNQVDKLEEDRNEELEKVLLDVLPTAFAIVKETAKRFTENETLEVTASMHDKQYAAQHEHVEIVSDKAIWKNRWKAAGVEMTW
ncbi:Protein translocase subunit SecA, partial [hydrothermal vent metagenome]